MYRNAHGMKVFQDAGRDMKQFVILLLLRYLFPFFPFFYTILLFNTSLEATPWCFLSACTLNRNSGHSKYLHPNYLQQLAPAMFMCGRKCSLTCCILNYILCLLNIKVKLWLQTIPHHSETWF